MMARGHLNMAVALVGGLLVIGSTLAQGQDEADSPSCLTFDKEQSNTSVEQTVNGIKCFSEKKYFAARNWWYEAATRNNDKWAQYNLGVLFAQEGDLLDPQMADFWFRKSAGQGFAPAQYNLGIRLSTGIGGSEDQSEGLKYIAAAAEGGLAEAQYELGVRYFWADGLPKDDFQSYVWLSSASKVGLDRAIHKLTSLPWNLHAADKNAAANLAENIFVDDHLSAQISAYILP